MRKKKNNISLRKVNDTSEPFTKMEKIIEYMLELIMGKKEKKDNSTS